MKYQYSTNHIHMTNKIQTLVYFRYFHYLTHPKFFAEFLQWQNLRKLRKYSSIFATIAIITVDIENNFDDGDVCENGENYERRKLVPLLSRQKLKIL
jgi:hypothetical protein